jgi:O-antigen/teichoic acid export membrane protein
MTFGSNRGARRSGAASPVARDVEAALNGSAMLRALSLTFVTSFIIQAANIASGVQLARLLGPESRGELAAVLLWPMLIAGFGSFALPDAITYAAAAGKAKPQELLASAIALAIALSLPLVAIGYFLMPVIFAGRPIDTIRVAQAYVAVIPLSLLGTFVVAVFQGAFHIAQWNLLRASVHVVYPAAIALLWWRGDISVVTCMEASLAANLAVCLLCGALVMQNGWRATMPRLAEMRGLVVYGMKVYVPAVVQAINERLDQAILSLLLAPADLGQYVVAVTVARAAGILTTTLQMLVLPAVAKTAPAEKAALSGRYVRLNTLISIFAAIALAALARELVRVAFGAQYEPSLPVAYILILASLPMSIKAMMNTMFKAHNQALHVSKVELAGLVATAVLLPLLIHFFGTVGAAFASVVVQGVTCAMMSYWARHILNIDRGRFFAPTLDDLVWATGKFRFGAVSFSRGRRHES